MNERNKRLNPKFNSKHVQPIDLAAKEPDKDSWNQAKHDKTSGEVKDTLDGVYPKEGQGCEIGCWVMYSMKRPKQVDPMHE